MRTKGKGHSSTKLKLRGFLPKIYKNTVMHFFNDTKVTVNIPAIYEILQNINEEIKLKFEINDKQGKFYLNPLTEKNINIKTQG